MPKIENKQQYYSAMAEIESYLQKGFASLTAKENDALAELSRAVEAWEINEYPMPMNPTFTDILIHLMNQSGSTQTELSEQLKISKSLLSEILNGNKQPNLDLVITLHKRFDIDANIIIEAIDVTHEEPENLPKTATKKFSPTRSPKKKPL
jgi:antitoxin component HigA of HigAB toxin-antitoxin module